MHLKHLKHLKSGLIVIGTAAAVWRLSEIVMSAYAHVGPFVSSSIPGLDAPFFNALESWLWNGVAKNGVPLSSWFGPYNVTTTPQFYNHNLHDQNGANVAPTVVLCQSNGTSISNWTIQADWASMTSTQVKLTSNNGGGGLSTYGVAMKF